MLFKKCAWNFVLNSSGIFVWVFSRAFGTGCPGGFCLGGLCPDTPNGYLIMKVGEPYYL